MAPIVDPHAGGDLWDAVLGSDAFDLRSRTAEVRHWLAAAAGEGGNPYIRSMPLISALLIE